MAVLFVLLLFGGLAGLCIYLGSKIKDEDPVSPAGTIINTTDTPFTEKETKPLISTHDGESKTAKAAKEDSRILFVPFVRGISASMSDSFVDHGGRPGSSSTAGIANDLTATVIKYEAEGYEFQKIETVHVDVSPGCLGMLMGKGKEYHPYDYLVFSRRPQETFNYPV